MKNLIGNQIIIRCEVVEEINIIINWCNLFNEKKIDSKLKDLMTDIRMKCNIFIDDNYKCIYSYNNLSEDNELNNSNELYEIVNFKDLIITKDTITIKQNTMDDWNIGNISSKGLSFNDKLKESYEEWDISDTRKL